MPPATADFFRSQKEHSRVKAEIVAKYAQAWARILTSHQRRSGRQPAVAFVDLFSGPGTYEDGTPSTPLLILKSAVEDPLLSPALRTYFNDADPSSIENLGIELCNFPGLERLAFQPRLSSEQASIGLIDSYGIAAGTPRLFFLDQFGWSRVTLGLIRRLLAVRSTECIFFLNYARLIAAFSNSVMTKNVIALLGSMEAVQTVKSCLNRSTDPMAREQIVLDAICDACKGVGAKYALSFAFKTDDRQRSTHHLMFLTTHDKGYERMKSIMGKVSSLSWEGIPTLSFITQQRLVNGNLFAKSAVEELADDLLQRFAGRSLTLAEIFFEDSPGKPFLPQIYREAALRLEAQLLVTTIPPASRRPVRAGQVTMAPTTRINFGENA